MTSVELLPLYHRRGSNTFCRMFPSYESVKTAGSRNWYVFAVSQVKACGVVAAVVVVELDDPEDVTVAEDEEEEDTAVVLTADVVDEDDDDCWDV